MGVVIICYKLSYLVRGCHDVLAKPANYFFMHALLFLLLFDQSFACTTVFPWT
jgi:hypothetical protein